ncbi:CAAX amino terminal protease self- immunity [Novipirellula aureliae]|uniref:CAAX amino terminal protease self-immunity n=1 Tax=Novipirellula aureliae TaxID=2527966 RepID=A0A5C6DT71_9BACT|nr:CPBP family intramembrane glutamic endopeptidase [Novipirellula aureliae]TWU39920.1 CAAX amino terminal protease self- immunity [Novipirellula aureliae]
METQFAAIIGAIVIAGLVGAVVLWTRTLSRIGASDKPWYESILATETGERPFWTVFDFLLAIGLSLVFTIFLQAAFLSLGWISRPAPDQPVDSSAIIAGLAAQSIAGPLAVFATIGWLRLIRKDALQQLGFAWKAGDFQLGLKWSLMLIPVVLMISSAIAFLVPYHHPILESLAGANSVLLFAVLFVGTAIVTPVVEEFLFRVMLQGGLQRMADSDVVVMRTDDTLIQNKTLPEEHASDPLNPYQPAEEISLQSTPSGWKPSSFWPIVAASFVFAMMHWGQGAAPIPLFFLSLGLGFLYRQTGRITGPVIVHIMLNSFTLSVEFFRLWAIGA